MKANAITKKQKLTAIIVLLPMPIGVIFLLIGIFTQDFIYLEPVFRIHFINIITLVLIQIVSLIILIRLDKIDLELPQAQLKKTFAIIALLIVVFIFNFLLEMGLRMNLNYWLKSNTVEKIELIVIDKNVTRGKTTNYNISFNSNNGKLRNRVGRKEFESFSIGEKCNALVYKGFYEGYFLTEPIHK